MATTLSNGVVIPDPADLIPGNGVQAFRDQGASVNSALGQRALTSHTHSWAQITGKPSTFTPASHTHAWSDLTDPPATYAPSAHTHPISDVDGLQSALDSAGGTPTWSAITDKPTMFPPSAHTHDDRYYTEAEVDAKIAAAVAALTPYSSGLRDLSSLLNADFTAAQIRVLRDAQTVTLHVVNLSYSGSSTGTVSVLVLPPGLRPPATASGYTTRGQSSIVTASGVFQVVSPTASFMNVTFTYQTLDAPPVTPPGTTA